MTDKRNSKRLGAARKKFIVSCRSVLRGLNLHKTAAALRQQNKKVDVQMPNGIVVTFVTIRGGTMADISYAGEPLPALRIARNGRLLSRVGLGMFPNPAVLKRLFNTVDGPSTNVA